MKRKNWIVEAANIKESKPFLNQLLYKTSSISEFLNDPNINFISATKGFGKTFVLKIKSINYRKNMKGVAFIPEKELVDKFVPLNKPDISQEIQKQYNQQKKHVQVWEIAILITVFAHTDLKDEASKIIEKISYLKGYMGKRNSYSVQRNYVMLLKNFNVFRDIMDKGVRDDLSALLDDLQHGVCIFIDNVDEFYGVEDSDDDDEKKIIYHEDIWFNAQIALIKCVYQLSQLNSHLHIYSTTRKRVLDKLQSTDIMDAQYLGSISEINYTKKELEKIFINNIRSEDEENLFYPDEIIRNPFSAFFGLKEITNTLQNVKKNEDIFTYIYRHTFGRPRDLMWIGGAISQLTLHSRENKERLKATINNYSYKIGNQYIKELEVFLNINFEKLYSLIDKNVLSKEEVKSICCKYNEIPSDSNCDNCKNATLLFSTLYSQGLIGFEHFDRFKEGWYQKFVTSGQQYFNEVKRTLPFSENYYIHPCLSEVIAKYRKENGLSDYLSTREIIVGDGLFIKKKGVSNVVNSIHVHFGAGNLGVGLVLKQFQSNNNIIIIQRESEKVRKYKNLSFVTYKTKTKNVSDEVLRAKVVRSINSIDFEKKEHVLFISDNANEIRKLITKSNSISTSIGRKGMLDLIRLFKNLTFAKEINFYPFENDVDSVDVFFNELNNNKMIRIDVMPDRICTDIKFLKSVISVKAEHYRETVIKVVNERIHKEIDENIYRATLVESNQYPFYKDRKYFLVNGIHMFIAIHQYDYCLNKEIPLEKAGTIPFKLLLDDPNLKETIDDLINLQSLRIIKKHQSILKGSLSDQFDELLVYASKVIERFNNPDDVLGRILSLDSSDLDNRKHKIFDRLLKILPIVSKEKEALRKLKIISDTDLDKAIDSILIVNSKLISILIGELAEKNSKINSYKENDERNT